MEEGNTTKPKQPIVVTGIIIIVIIAIIAILAILVILGIIVILVNFPFLARFLRKPSSPGPERGGAEKAGRADRQEGR